MRVSNINGPHIVVNHFAAAIVQKMLYLLGFSEIALFSFLQEHFQKLKIENSMGSSAPTVKHVAIQVFIICLSILFVSRYSCSWGILCFLVLLMMDLDQRYFLLWELYALGI